MSRQDPHSNDTNDSNVLRPQRQRSNVKWRSTQQTTKEVKWSQAKSQSHIFTDLHRSSPIFTPNKLSSFWRSDYPFWETTCMKCCIQWIMMIILMIATIHHSHRSNVSHITKLFILSSFSQLLTFKSFKPIGTDLKTYIALFRLSKSWKAPTKLVSRPDVLCQRIFEKNKLQPRPTKGPNLRFEITAMAKHDEMCNTKRMKRRQSEEAKEAEGKEVSASPCQRQQRQPDVPTLILTVEVNLKHQTSKRSQRSQSIST